MHLNLAVHITILVSAPVVQLCQCQGTHSCLLTLSLFLSPPGSLSLSLSLPVCVCVCVCVYVSVCVCSVIKIFFMLTLQYKHAELARRDISQALQHYRDLRPSLEPFGKLQTSSAI